MVIHIYLNLIAYEEDRKLSLIDTKEMKRYSEIGTSIANDLIKEGRTLQLGICTTSQLMVLNFKHHKKLCAHTEMFGESLLDLFKLDVISNVFKKEHCDRSAESFVIGNQETYEFIDNNPIIYIGKTNVNDISVIANNINVSAIDSALEMDLSRQVVVNSIRLTIFSGVGKHVICLVVVIYRVPVGRSFLLFFNIFLCCFLWFEGNQLTS